MAEYTPTNILITGAAGFIASHVSNHLGRNYLHYKITVLDKLDYCSSLKNLSPSQSSPNFKFFKGDITNPNLVKFILVRHSIDTIMNFAAQTHVDNSFGNSLEFTKKICGTHVLLEAAKELKGQIKRDSNFFVIFMFEKCKSRLLPTNPYGATKAGAEMLVMAYGRSYGLPVITTRGNNVYGPNQYPEKKIPKFILLAKEGKTLPLHGDGSSMRSFLYVEDVAEAFEIILHKGETGHIYNVGTERERKVIDVAKDICKLFSLDPEEVIKSVANRPFNDRSYFLGYTKLKNLGWSERTSWEDGINNTVEWYVNNAEWWGNVSGALLAHPKRSTTNVGSNPVKVDELKSEYDNVCTLRIRMPISSDLGNPHNFITKIVKYDKVVNIPNSKTILDELLPISIDMAKGNLTGIWNFTNPGALSHNEVLELYKRYIDPCFKWTNFTVEEQAKVLLAPRSNNEMDVSKLNNEFPELLLIKESLIKYVFEPNKKILKSKI